MTMTTAPTICNRGEHAWRTEALEEIDDATRNMTKSMTGAFVDVSLGTHTEKET